MTNPSNRDDLHCYIDLETTHFWFNGRIIEGKELAKLLLSCTDAETQSLDAQRIKGDSGEALTQNYIIGGEP